MLKEMVKSPGCLLESPPSPRKCKWRRCVGCGSVISDRFILSVAPDLEWHASCLKCVECREQLADSCYIQAGKTYCKRDYHRLFVTKCAKCEERIYSNETVMRARDNVYHLDCFRCVICCRNLNPGDEFSLRDDGLFCKLDTDMPDRSADDSGVELREREDGSPGNNNDPSLGDHNSPSPDPCKDSQPRRNGHRKGDKTTRVRTVMNEKQLHTLRTCYSANPRPDALMKEQLVEMTGLSPRVIRVWFQNKRCKDKKRQIAMKNMQQQQEKQQQILSGVPMVASSPVRHEPPPNLAAAPVEVQTYPWKALSEFALNPDLEQPPFQQLVNAFDGDPSMMMQPGSFPLIGSHPSHMDHMTANLGMTSLCGGDDSLSDVPGTPSEMSSPNSQ